MSGHAYAGQCRVMTLSVLLTSIFLGGQVASAATCDYFASPGGTGSELSQSSPFKVADLWPLAAPGKKLCLLDGVYRGSQSMIKPPADVYSYISKAFVDAQGDGTTGVVNADGTQFYAASLEGPGESYKVQDTLKRGDKVTIVAEEGSFYKVASPTDAYVFVRPGMIAKAQGGSAEQRRGAGE